MIYKLNKLLAKVEYLKIFKFLKPILHHRLLFVFDGKAPESKREELNSRKISNSNKQDEINSLRLWLSSDINEDTKDLIRLHTNRFVLLS